MNKKVLPALAFAAAGAASLAFGGEQLAEASMDYRQAEQAEEFTAEHYEAVESGDNSVDNAVLAGLGGAALLITGGLARTMAEPEFFYIRPKPEPQNANR